MLAFLGMGLLGSAFVRALRKHGEDVQVWNRTREKARALESFGARSFDTPEAAVRGASRVHLTLSDDNAVDDVLELARPGFEHDVVIINHSTTSLSGTRDRYARWKERGVAFQHAPVFMGPQNALESTGVMMTSGDKALCDRLAPELSKMTSKLIYLGETLERAAGFKLLGNSFLMAVTAGLSDMLALAKAADISPTDAASLFDWFNPGTSIPARAKRMIEGDPKKPSWELAMARKDARLMIEAAREKNVLLAVLPSIAEEMDRWIARGHAGDDWTVIARDAL